MIDEPSLSANTAVFVVSARVVRFPDASDVIVEHINVGAAAPYLRK